MAGNPDVFALLEEMLDSGRTPEEVCRDCPELLPEVRRRWKAFRLVDGSLAALFPDPETPPRADAIVAVPHPAELPQVPGYRVEALLGRGGMGVVYRAWHLRLNRAVALKMLLAGPCARPEELERFLREAQAVAGLGHPNIVQVYDVGDVEGRPYFTMELVEGGNLADQIRGVPQPAHQAAALRGDAGRSDPRGASERYRASRSQAGQHPAHPGRHAQGDRLWPGSSAGRRRGTDAERRAGGDAELHGPRASARRKAGDRAGHGRVRPGGNPVRAAHGPAAVPRRERDGNAPAGADRRAGVSDTAEPAGAARPDNDLPEVLVQGAAPALRQRRRTGGRPPPVSSRGADRGAPGRAVGAPRPMGAA